MIGVASSVSGHGDGAARQPAQAGADRRGRRFERALARKAAGAVTIILMIVFSLIAALRRDTFDTGIYRDYFKFCHDGTSQWAFYDNQNFELGFQLLTRAIAAWTDDVRFYFFLLTFIGLACALRAARLFRLPPLAVLLYFAASLYPLLFLVQMRQGLANCLGFLGLAFYARGKLVKGGGLLLIATSIHASAALLLMMMFCYWLWSNARTTLGVWVFVVIGAIYASKALLYSLDWGRVTYYLTNPDFNQTANIFRVSTFKYIGLAAGGALLLRNKSDHAIRLLVIVAVAAVIVRVVFSDNAAFSGRLGASLTFCEIFLLPWLLERLGRVTFWIGLPVISVLSAYYLLYIEHPEILVLY